MVGFDDEMSVKDIAFQMNTETPYRKHINTKLALLSHYQEQEKKVKEDLDRAKKDVITYNEATQWLRDLYEQTQERFQGQIMSIVSQCLKDVFGEEAYEFLIKFEQKRGQVEASFVFVRDGEEFDPIDASGGGALAVACFALRVAVIYLTRDYRRRILILDEPFSQLSVEYRTQMANLVRTVAERFDFQFILITHSEEFEIGRVYKVTKQEVVFSGLNI